MPTEGSGPLGAQSGGGGGLSAGSWESLGFRSRHSPRQAINFNFNPPKFQAGTI